jgi:hypothetical protein
VKLVKVAILVTILAVIAGGVGTLRGLASHSRPSKATINARWAFTGSASTSGPPESIVFPVVGQVSYEDDFGDPRRQGRHEGNDILADRRAPEVAVEDGKIEFWTTSARAGCMLYLYGRSGTTYLYVHLNNDLTDGNDNEGSCVPGIAYAPGLRNGEKVRAGQLIGFVGDSGDADGTHPHLHFELHPHDGAAVSPYPWLQQARSLLFAAPAEPSGTSLAGAPSLTLTLYGTISSVEPARLALRIERVRLSNGWRSAVRRDVILAVSARTRVERAAASRREAATLESVAPGARVVVSTAALPLGLDAQEAKPGVLSAAQVLLRGES